MNDTVPLHAHLLGRGEQLIRMGCTRSALVALQRLLNLPVAPVGAKAESHRLLGELAFAAARFRRARRHFAAAISLRPYQADVYARYAAAVEVDVNAHPRKGLAALRRAICIEPREPLFWTARGRLALRAGDRKQSLRSFRRAARLRPEKPNVLAEVVDGFVAVDREDEARKLLVAARFQAPNDAGVVQLWNRFQFDCVRAKQLQVARGARAIQMILPFPEPVAASTPVAGQSVVIRADRVSRSRPHVLRLFPVNRHGS